MTRALVVDDEPDEAALLATHLRRAGCDVDLAASGEEALASDVLDALDVVFVDLRLPGMGGWELVRALHERAPRLPVVVASVLDEQDYPPATVALPKPFTGSAVQRALDEALGGEAAGGDA
ncbi:response regulator [Cellulomonas massiliensis]|uniref:response regulator n=1 Tax=Cellulomonas massiliensis TaxID=1465811 RepID=UPI00030C1207|nr:response regulator [Cellulomonas massiliensis]